MTFPCTSFFMFLLLKITIIITTLTPGVSSTTFTFLNNCPYTIWPGIQSSSGSPNLPTTGFELPKSTSRTLQSPSGWSGRFWGRTGCNFNSTGHGSCSTGDCNSNQLECNGNGAKPPVTLAEFTLTGGRGATQDFYDVSLVDGYNLPMIVEVSGGGDGDGVCGSTGCVEDLNVKCPAELRVVGNDGTVEGCRSACEEFGTDEFCCRGVYGTAEVCKPTVYSALFKSVCPKSYSYAYDDATSTFTCHGGVDYTVTFCPASTSSRKTAAAEQVSANGDGDESTTGSWWEDFLSGSSSRSCGDGLFLWRLVVVVFSAWLLVAKIIG